MSLLVVANLGKSFGSGRRRGTTSVLADVSFDLDRGETLALVGESGAGKSTTARIVNRLVEPDAGSVTFDGIDVRALRGSALRAFRRRVQMVFQDPYSSLDPAVPVGASVAEPLVVHRVGTAGERREQVAQLLERVGLSARFAARYPGELSGGQLQRVAIARALAVRPDLIICDEPVAALDASVQAQVLNLLRDVQEEYGVAYLFISHDLAVVEAFADRVAVMHEGRIVEVGPVEQVLGDPRDAYTRELLAAVPGRSLSAVARVDGLPDWADPAEPGAAGGDRCPAPPPADRVGRSGGAEVSDDRAGRGSPREPDGIRS
ncbi:MAG: ATP-binding cassette domain-containing protein [Acidimicrobiia bacterium]